MRVDVTPLGATSGPVTAVARAVVDYLEESSEAPAPALLAPSRSGRLLWGKGRAAGSRNRRRY
jgi:hypothetical protein